MPLCDKLPDDVLMQQIVPMLGVIPLTFMQLTSKAVRTRNVWDHIASLRLDGGYAKPVLNSLRKYGASKIRRLVLCRISESLEWPLQLFANLRQLAVYGDTSTINDPVETSERLMRFILAYVDFDKLTHLRLPANDLSIEALLKIANKPRPNLQTLVVTKMINNPSIVDFLNTNLDLPNIRFLWITISRSIGSDCTQVGDRWWISRWLDHRSLFKRCNNPQLQFIKILGPCFVPTDNQSPKEALASDFEQVFGIPMTKFIWGDRQAICWHAVDMAYHAEVLEILYSTSVRPKGLSDILEVMKSKDVWPGHIGFVENILENYIHHISLPDLALAMKQAINICQTKKHGRHFEKDDALLEELTKFVRRRKLRIGPCPVHSQYQTDTLHSIDISASVIPACRISMEYYKLTGRLDLLTMVLHSYSFVRQFILSPETQKQAMALFAPSMELKDFKALYYKECYNSVAESIDLVPAQCKSLPPWEYFPGLGINYAPLFE